MSKLIFIIPILFTTYFSAAQPPPVPSPHLHLAPGTRITAFCETARFQWVGTTNGLYRLNKANNRTWLLRVKNSPLPDNLISCIASTSYGTYIGTSSGIMYWDGYAFLVITMENSRLPENDIISIKEDVYGHLLIGTRDSGILKTNRNCMKVERVY